MRPSFAAPLIILILLSALWFACRNDLEKQTRWDVDVLTPLLKGDLTIGDLVEDSLLEENPDQSLQLVYQSSLYTYNLVDESIQIPDTTLETFVSLDSLRLDDQTIEERISLGAILSEIPGGDLLLALANLGLPLEIPAINDLSSGVVELDASLFFQTAVIDSGFLDIAVTNGLPVDVEDVKFRLVDQLSGVEILEDSFDFIPIGATVLSTSDLSGLTISSVLEAELTRISTDGSDGAIVVDTSDAVQIEASVRNLSVLEATAIFPAQDLVEIKEDVKYEMGGPEITEMKIASGNIKIFVVNTIEDSIYIEYRIPGARNSMGQSVVFEEVVPPAPPGSTVIVDETFDLAGYEIDLRGSSGTTYNTFYNEFTARIDSTGKLVNISLDDSIEVRYGLENIVPAEIRGYAGQYELLLEQEEADFDLLNSISSGSLELEEVNVGLGIWNGIGVEGQIIINELRAINNRNESTVALSAPGIIDNPVYVNRALDNPFVPGITEIALNNSNSNIRNLVEILPDQLLFDAALDVNPNGNVFSYQDFVLEDSELDVSLDIEMPLSFIANDLTLLDTLAFTFPRKEDGSSAIKAGSLNLDVSNGFPLEAGLQMYFLDEEDDLIDSLFQSGTVPAGVLGGDCRVSQPAPANFLEIIPEERMQALLATEQVVIQVVFNTVGTAGCDGPLKIYSNYGINFNLVGDFTYGVSVEF